MRSTLTKAQDSTAAGAITHLVANPVFDRIGAHIKASARCTNGPSWPCTRACGRTPSIASYARTVTGGTTFGTLLLPSTGAADPSVAVERLPVSGATPFEATALNLGARGEGVYGKSWNKQASRPFGPYDYDGKMFYTETGAAGQTVVMVRGTSSVTAPPGSSRPSRCRTWPCAPGPAAPSASTAAACTASTDQARATAPGATKVLPNGTQVPFTRDGALVYAAAV